MCTTLRFLHLFSNWRSSSICEEHCAAQYSLQPTALPNKMGFDGSPGLRSKSRWNSRKTKVIQHERVMGYHIFEITVFTKW